MFIKGKNKQKKTFWLVTAGLTVALLCFILVTALPVFAQDDYGLNYGTGLIIGQKDVRVIVFEIIRIFFGILGIIAVILIIYGGWMYMTSAGNTDRLEKARKILINALIGLIIIMSAFAIVHFILRQLEKALGIDGPSGGAPTVTYFGGGALGDGPIRSLYPAPNQRGVPRNTLVIITFKQAVDPKTIADDTDGDGTYADPEGDDELIASSIIFKNQKTEAILTGPDVRVMTNDNKTFVFDPVGLLGSEYEWQWQEVTITATPEHIHTGKSIYADYYSASYTWKFQISTLVDLTPPQVTSVFPWSSMSKVPPNAIIRMDFSEAMNPIGVSGTAPGFKNVMVRDITTSADIPGKFVISNQYRTVEFFPEAKCEGKDVNSCGDPVYCLPGDSKIEVTIKSAPLTDSLCKDPTGSAINGATDAASNSLDGNKDNEADGCGVTDVYPPAVPPNPAGDGITDYNACNNKDICGKDDRKIWSFTTSNKPDFNPPKIKEVEHKEATDSSGSSAEKYPPASLTDVPQTVSLTAPVRVIFDKLMLSSYLRPDGRYGDGREYVYLLSPFGVAPVGYYLSNTTGDGCSRDCLREGSMAAGFTCGGGGTPDVLTSGGGEDCDDGNTIDGDGCSSDCLHEGNAVCGDGRTGRGEDKDCDTAAGISPGCYPKGGLIPCTRKGAAGSICINPLTEGNCCGNGSIDPEIGEECDQGLAGDATCQGELDSAPCTHKGTAAPVCGNGIIDPGEDCDDFNAEPGDGCADDCLHEGAYCGDGVVSKLYEECEQTISGEEYCNWNCLWRGTLPELEGGTCGSGAVDVGEECDDGQAGLDYQETKLYIDHDEFAQSTTYGAKVGSGVKDAFQNCYYPSSGWEACPDSPDCIYP